MKFLMIRKPRTGAERPAAKMIGAHKEQVLSRVKGVGSERG